MESVCIRLEACDPAQGRFRAYRIEAGIDLLGDWVVNVTYGRMGARGRHIRHVAIDEPQARRIVRQCLTRQSRNLKAVHYHDNALNHKNPFAASVNAVFAVHY